jgi:sulfate permease, SulP family
MSLLSRSATQKKGNIFDNFRGDALGGTSAMLVALPATLAYGILAYTPLGTQFSGFAAIGAVLGFIAINLVAPFLSSKKTLVTAPTAAAAAVVSLFVKEMISKGLLPPEIIPVYVAFLTILSGILQILMGSFGGGKFIKYIPYPVITGYLMGANIQILLGQLPKLLGLPRGTKWMQIFGMWQKWQWQSICIGVITIICMRLSKKYFKNIPAVMTGLTTGIVVFLCMAISNPGLLSLENNSMIIGKLATSGSDILYSVTSKWAMMPHVNLGLLSNIIVPSLTLTILLSITTLNGCLVLDTRTHSNHDPKKELLAQGFGNIASSLFGGIPGSGHLTATLENMNNGGKTGLSVLFVGITTILILAFAGNYLEFIPIAALAGILINLATNAIDFKLIGLLKNKSTIFDFFVILSVVISAVSLDLVKGAGVGIAMAIFLFLREQMSITVIRRKLFGNQIFSKKQRISSEQKILEARGSQTIILEIQGQLFFGTTEQLYSNLETYYDTCKYFILDLRRIQSIDFTAANMLKKIVTRIKDLHGYLIFTSVPTVLPTGIRLKDYLYSFGLFQHDNLKTYDSTEDALEWVEDQIIAAENMQLAGEHELLHLNAIELFEQLPTEALELLEAGMKHKQLQTGELIFRAGDVSDEIYFIRKGTVKIVIPLNDGKFYHIVTIGKGGVFGEMAFIDNIRRSADAIAMEEVHLFVLSQEKFEIVTKAHPEIAGIFFHRLALLTVKRLRQSNKELKVFQEN